MVKRWLGMLAVALVLAACGTSSASSSVAAPAVKQARCGPRAASTLASSRVARVYVANKLVYACSVKGSASYLLGTRSPCLAVPCVAQVKVVGELVAYASTHRGVDAGFTTVIVRRLTDGKTLVDDSATVKPLGPESFQSVDSLVLARDGAVAWIGEAHSIVRPGSSDIEVVKHDRDGRKLLDSGGAIRTGSLRLHRSTLTWRDGSATRSVSLR